MNALPIRAIAAALLAIVVAGALASCGKKEPLKPPPGSTYPRHYPPAPKPDAK
jgi:predicted small lipoprotein YifL